MTVCSDATARWDGAAAGRELVQRHENHKRRTCWRSTLVAGGGDQRRQRYGPKGRRSGSPMLERW
jgi:hypothetical protein